MAARRRAKEDESARPAAMTASPAAAEDAPRSRGFTWDDRRQLALDIGALAAPDVPGVLLIARELDERREAGVGALHIREPAAAAAASSAASSAAAPSAWDVRAHELPSASASPSFLPPPLGERGAERLALECGVDLEAASEALLRALRAYVDDCFVPALAPRQHCGICQGLWSCGRVVACGRDACAVRVHEECFGVLLRARGDDGEWRCPSCLLGRELLCAVCMQPGGALKPVAAGATGEEPKWVHVLCALAIPELSLRDVPTMEPVDGFEAIENGRFRYLCGVCRKRGGACVICEHEGCNAGMHPQCAADAGLMIGAEANALGIFCEKHLPLARVPGATRWISDEDLVEDIMSEYSVDEEFFHDEVLVPSDGDLAAATAAGRDPYAFVLESTAFLARRLRLLGGFSASTAPATVAGTARTELKARDVRAVHPTTFAASVAQPPPVFPPAVGTPRLGLPPFPIREDAVGAIVDYLAKDRAAWERARVLAWDAERGMHLIQLVRSDQRLYAALSAANTLVLYVPGEENALDGVRVRLYRPRMAGDTGPATSKDEKKKPLVPAPGDGDGDGDSDGARQWRPRPRQFASD